MTDVNDTTVAADSTSEVRSATDALHLARAEFEKAREYYQRVRRRAARGVETLRGMSVGDVCDDALKVVRRYPGASVTVAALAGFLLGRWFRR
jgi:hypothetical protein